MELTKSIATSLHLELPATSANLGPAFDAAALAIDLSITIDATPSENFAISATGRDAAVCENLENHLIFSTYQGVMQSQSVEAVPLSLRIKNEMPIGKGTGSSASARLAGIALANHYGELRWSDEQIIAEASRREHHSDNVAACWMGGLTVARAAEDGETHIACIRPEGKWPLLLAIPEEALATEKARSVLPDRYSRADAVLNIQNSMLLLAAFAQGRHELLTHALEDRIHQPYRAELCPLLPCLQASVGKYGILGVALSGAGPSVLIFLNPESDQAESNEGVASTLRKSDLRAELIATAMTFRGARDTIRSAPITSKAKLSPAK